MGQIPPRPQLPPWATEEEQLQDLREIHTEYRRARNMTLAVLAAGWLLGLVMIVSTFLTR